MKTILRIGFFLLATTLAWGQTNNLTGLLQQGLFEEQANRNLEAAIADYQTLAAQFDKDRQLAATAVFRLGECYRAQGHTNEAAAQYQRIIHEFSDQQTLATLSRQNLAGMGVAGMGATGGSTGAVEPAAVESPDTQLWNKLKDLSTDELAKMLPTLMPDATLDTLLQQRNDAEAKLAQIGMDYSPSNIVYVRQVTALKEIKRQTAEKIFGMMEALKLRAELQPQQRGSFQTRLQSIIGKASSPQSSGGENSTEARSLASQIAGIEKLSSDPEEQARAVLAIFPDDTLKKMLLHLPAVQAQAARLRANPQLTSYEHNQYQVPIGRDQLDITSAVGREGTNLLAEAERVLTLQNLYIKERVDFILGLQSARLKALLAADGMDDANSPAQAKSAPVTDEEAHEIQRIQQLIQNSPDLINGSSSSGTPLANAAHSGWLRVAAYLLDHGADVNAASIGIRGARVDVFDLNGARVTPLLAAVDAGNKAMAQLLIDHGADIRFKGPQGNTPLHLATKRGFQAVTEVLLASHADVNALNDAGTTPLFSAVEGEQVKIVQLLLAAGATVNLKDAEDRTVLNYAIGTSLEMVKTLLDAHADPNTVDQQGRTPLSYETERGSSAGVKLFLAAKADPNAGSLDSPLLCAIHKNELASAEPLLQAGANPNAQGRVNWDVTINGNHNSGANRPWVSPLNLAVVMKQGPMVQLLLKLKANPDDSQTGGRPVIFDAVSDTNVLAALLAGGANVELQDSTVPNAGERPWTPLRTAVWQQSPVAVDMLLQHGANPNARDASGNAPLHWAVSQQRDKLREWNFKVVELLLDHGAEPNVRNNAGNLPLDSVARWLGSGDAESKLNATKIAALLRQHGALDKLPDWDAITMSRPAANFSYPIFHKGTNDWNQFTLLEAIINFYTSSQNYSVPQGNGTWSGYSLSSMLSFPDLTRVTIVRPARNSTNETRMVVNVLNDTNGIDCSKDVPLVFGDVVEIPERNHPLGARSAGLVGNQQAMLAEYIQNSVRLEVQDKHIDIVFFRNGGQALLSTILDSQEARKLLLSSSDLSRVKITRRDSKTGKSREWILDCAPPQTAANANNGTLTFGSGGLPLAVSPPLAYQWYNGGNNSSSPENANELWLRDGDMISVPEKR